MRETVMEFARLFPDGFTLDLRTMKLLKFGVAVAYAETQNSHTPDQVDVCIAHALAHDQVLGGWQNDENNEFYFDSVRVFKNSELEDAIEFGRQQKQIAIFDLTNLKEYKL
jgi:hypothetical protein